MNTPYKKQISENGVILNPITKETPYKQTSSTPKRVHIYVIMNDGSKLKNRGNNRKNSSKRKGKSSRLHSRITK